MCLACLPSTMSSRVQACYSTERTFCFKVWWSCCVDRHTHSAFICPQAIGTLVLLCLLAFISNLSTDCFFSSSEHTPSMELLNLMQFYIKVFKVILNVFLHYPRMCSTNRYSQALGKCEITNYAHFHFFVKCLHLSTLEWASRGDRL